MRIPGNNKERGKPPRLVTPRSERRHPALEAVASEVEVWTHPQRAGHATLASERGGWRMSWPGDSLMPDRVVRTRREATTHLERYGWEQRQQARARRVPLDVAIERELEWGS